MINEKICIECNELKDISCFKKCKRGVRNVCKECRRKHEVISQKLKKEFVNKHGKLPTVCECCKNESRTIVCDHDHQTNELRGWLCHQCNRSIGQLGDTLEGVMLAVEYLKRAADKA